MKTFHVLLAVLGLAACGALRADDAKPAARVDVVYVNPEKFTSVTDDYFVRDEGRDQYLGTLKQHIEALAERYIPAGQHLAMRITDLKMAGDFEPQRGPGFEHIRIYREIYPPRINYEFKLTDANGKVLKEGVRQIVDMDYLDLVNPYFEDDTLRYEKKMIDDCFYREFDKAKG